MSDNNNQDSTHKLLEEILLELKKFNSIRYGLMLRFIQGIFYALGATAGLAILVTVFGFIVHLFGGVPILGNVLVEIGNDLHGAK